MPLQNINAEKIQGNLAITSISATTTLTISSLAATATTSSPIVFVSTGGTFTTKISDLVWDDTNNRLGVNQQGLIPSATLDVHGVDLTVPVAQFNQTFTTQTPTGGTIVQLVYDPSAAIISGTKMNSLQFAGSYDTTHTFNRGASIAAFATENWSPTANGTRLVFSVVSGGTTTRNDVLTLNQDRSSSFAGSVSATAYVGDGSGLTNVNANVPYGIINAIASGNYLI